MLAASGGISSGDLPALVVAFGTALAAVIGALLMRGRRPAERPVEGWARREDDGDPDDRPGRLRERLSSLEARVTTLELEAAEARVAHNAAAAGLKPPSSRRAR